MYASQVQTYFDSPDWFPTHLLGRACLHIAHGCIVAGEPLPNCQAAFKHTKQEGLCPADEPLLLRHVAGTQHLVHQRAV